MKITKEILESNGFALKDLSGFDWEDDDIKEYVLLTHTEYALDLPKYHLNMSNLSNTVGRDWSCHIDNEDFETVASADIDTIEQFNDLMKLMEINYELKV